MNSEDDTYKALKQVPYETMKELILKMLNDSIETHILNDSIKDIHESLKEEMLLKQHGWIPIDFWIESQKRSS